MHVFGRWARGPLSQKCWPGALHCRATAELEPWILRTPGLASKRPNVLGVVVQGRRVALLALVWYGRYNLDFGFRCVQLTKCSELRYGAEHGVWMASGPGGRESREKTKETEHSHGDDSQGSLAHAGGSCTPAACMFHHQTLLILYKPRVFSQNSQI